MATRDDRNVFQRLREMGEEQLNRVLEEMMSSPRFADILGKTIQQAMATKGSMDRNMQTILSLFNLPSKADYKKLSTKIEALQGSLVNLNIKLDRMQGQARVARARNASSQAEAETGGKAARAGSFLRVTEKGDIQIFEVENLNVPFFYPESPVRSGTTLPRRPIPGVNSSAIARSDSSETTSRANAGTMAIGNP